MIPTIIEMMRQVAAHPETLPALAPYQQQVVEMGSGEVAELLRQVVELVENPELSARREPLDQALQAILQSAVEWRQQQTELAGESQSIYQQSLESLYDWAPPESMSRNLVLAWLSLSGTGDPHHEPSLRRWCQFVCENPPEHRSSIQLAFGALMRKNYDPPMWLLEKLLHEGIVHSQIAPAIFDLFNFYFREGILERHPAAERAEELTALVGKIGESLHSIERGAQTVHDPAIIGKQVSDSVAMIVALSDALALLDYRAAVSELTKLLNLKHRRVQVEVAAAAAKLGSEEGKAALIKLAEEPVCRLRVLAFAEELGFENEVSLELRGDIARAESELAIWLSEPQQVGVAPTKVKLVDSRELFWPSYEDKMSCYLFEYTYGIGEQATTNIGIAGPMTYAFPADLSLLELEDIYALFAGWQAVHQDIFLMSVERAAQAFPREWKLIMQHIEDSDFQDPIVQTASGFFGRITGIVSCQKADADGNLVRGTAIFEGNDSTAEMFFPEGSEQAPLNWELALCVWRGQQLLSTFNPVE